MEKHPLEETISAYMDGVLSVDDTRRIGAHITDCDRCRLVLRSLRGVKSLLRAAPAPAALPESFWDDTLRRMRVDDARAAPGPPREWSLRRLGLAACAAGLALASFLLHPAASPAPVQQGVAVAQQDTLDIADVAQFVREHADIVATQPLADHNRQRMMSADVARSQIDDDSSDVPANADSPL